MASASASASPTPFTFASPISSSSETHDEDALDFDYESWIQQSKMANCYSNHHHQEMMLRVADNLPEEAYELSLRDFAELSLHPAPPPPPPGATPPTTTRSVHRRHKSSSSISMEAAGSFIIKLFTPSPSRAAASGGGGRRNKSFSDSLKAVSVLRKRSASANHGRSRSMENNGIQSNGYHDSTKRKPMSCYPFFKSSKYKAKHKFTGNQ